MFSQEVYEKTRKEVFQLLTAGECLPKEDISMLRSFANSKDPKGVLVCARGLKDEGNVFFKKRMFEEALEKYGYAGLVVICYEFGEEHRDEFFDLITSILLNFAACFIKKQVFDYVGLICIVILDFNPNQTKSLFRRAIAAVELGRMDLAKWNLLLASEIDPTNKEIREKLDQVSSHTCLNGQEKHGQDIPIGLGLGVPPLKKKKTESLSTQMDGVNTGVEANRREKTCSTKKATVGNGEKSEEDNKEVEVKEGLILSSSVEDMANKPLSSVEGDDHEMKMKTDYGVVVEDVLKCSTVEKPYLAELEYRFVNRRKADSYLSFRGEMYQKLRVGKSIQYVNSKTGSYMTIKMMPRTTKCSQKNVKGEVTQMEEEANSISHENLSKEVVEDNLMEESAVNDDSSNVDDALESDTVGSEFPTQSEPQTNPRQDRKSQKAAGKKKKIANLQTLCGARERQARKRNINAGRSNLCGCRYKLSGRKRSLVIPSSEAATEQRRKILISVPGPVIINGSNYSSSLCHLQPSLESSVVSTNVIPSMHVVSPTFREVALTAIYGG